VPGCLAAADAVESLDPMGDDRYFRDWPAPDPKAAVALIHGLAEHSGRYEHVAARLNDAGYAMVGVDIRGHGRSAGWPGQVGGLDDWIADAKAVLARARAVVGDRPLFLMGHSMGALIAAAYVIRAGGGGLAGLVLSSLAVLPGQALLGSMGDPEGQGIPSTALSRDVAVQRAYDEDPLVFADRVPPESTAAALEAAIEANQGAGRITLPVLMFHGELDAIADFEGARDFFENLGSTDKHIRIYGGLLHETMNEPEHDQVLDDLVAWLDDHAG
jgi:acylglycerol lipase